MKLTLRVTNEGRLYIFIWIFSWFYLLYDSESTDPYYELDGSANCHTLFCVYLRPYKLVMDINTYNPEFFFGK